jgi:hypothetical protein
MKRFVLYSVFAMLATFLGAGSAFAAGGSCPTGANYLSLTSPQTGGGLGSVTLSSLGVTSCYFISSTGVDTNAGTSEASPWLHAPGMPSCTGVCASVTPTAGVGFIFQGGGTWHRSSGTPGIGGNLSLSQSGSSGSPIYFGVDPTWFSGGSFARPIFSSDNPLSTNTVSSCSFPDDGGAFLNVSGANVIVDGFEFTGECMSGSGDGSVVQPGINKNQVFERIYVHGWTYTGSVGDDGLVMFGNEENSQEDTDRFLFDVVDGADSTFGAGCTTPSCVIVNGGNNFVSNGASGWAFGYGWDVEYSVIRHVSNGIQAGDIGFMIGNLMEYQFEPSLPGGRHGNVVEQNFGTECTVGYFYNNVDRNTNEGINWATGCATQYIFNNVFDNDGHFPPDPNGILIGGPGRNGTSVVTAYIYNNTAQDVQFNGAQPNASWSGWASGSSSTWANNQIMDFTSINSFSGCGSDSGCTRTDNGGEKFMTTSVANADGYTIANNYAPTASSSPTVGAGINATSFCSTIPNSAAIAACESGSGGAVAETSNWGGEFASYPNIPSNTRPLTGAWDAGAYEFSPGSTAGQPNPPTNLKVVVQ